MPQTLDQLAQQAQAPERIGAVRGTVSRDVLSASDDLFVTVQAFDGGRQLWGPCPWTPSDVLPIRGDDCLVVFDERQTPCAVILEPPTSQATHADDTWHTMNARSLAFLQDQMKAYVRGTTRATIEPTVDYPYGYKGPVSGKFNLTEQFGAAAITPEPSGGGAVLHVDGPLDPDGEVPDGYRQSVKGHLNVPFVAGDTVRVWKQDETGQLYLQTPTAAVAANATWTADLSTVPANRFGYWRFQLWRSGAQVGDLCPANVPPPASTGQTYSDLIVEHSVIADLPYLYGTTPAMADGTFRFAASLNGFKQFRLKRQSTGALLADFTTLFGCIRSYLPYPGEDGYGTNFVDRNYSYDSSVAVIAALAIGRRDVAAGMVRGMLQMFTPQTPAWAGAHPGGFSWSCMQTAPGYTYWDPVYRTGVHAWCTYALLCYMEACPLDTSYPYATIARQALAYADTLYATSGGNAGMYTGGSGRYTQAGDYDPNYVLPWSGTEHQLDLWHMWDQAYKVLGDAAFATKRDNLAQVMLDKLWYPSKQRLLQGIGNDGTPDDADPLDCHTWGAVWLHKIGRDDLAQIIMSAESLAPLTFESHGAKGYGPYYPGEGGYPGAVPTVWSEGTFGAALAFLALGDVAAWRRTIEDVLPLQMEDGGFRYVTDEDVLYELTTSRSCIGCSWSILAVSGLWGTRPVRDV